MHCIDGVPVYWDISRWYGLYHCDTRYSAGILDTKWHIWTWPAHIAATETNWIELLELNNSMQFCVGIVTRPALSPFRSAAAAGFCFRKSRRGLALRCVSVCRQLRIPVWHQFHSFRKCIAALPWSHKVSNLTKIFLHAVCSHGDKRYMQVILHLVGCSNDVQLLSYHHDWRFVLGHWAHSMGP